jgi:outer membrane protein TolC
VKIGSLSEYLEKARLLRPEIRMLRAGVRLRYAKLKLERSQFWPDFLIVGTFGWAHSEAVDDQRNPFVKDEFNFLRAGIGALLRLKLDFPIDWFKTRRAKAELEETLLLEKYALQGIGLEIEKAWIEAKKAEERIKAAQKGQKAARAWLVSVSQGFAAGLTEIKDVTEALVAFFKTKLSYIKAIYDFNIASISLTFAVGGE